MKSEQKLAFMDENRTSGSGLRLAIVFRPGQKQINSSRADYKKVAPAFLIT